MIEQNTVVLSLEKYEQLKNEIQDYKQKVIDAELKFASLKIFECTSGSYFNRVVLAFTEDAQQFIDKAFCEFELTYDKKSLKECEIWEFGKLKNVEKKEGEIF